MNFFKKNIRTIIGCIVGVILASSITVYAYSYIASDVKYTKKDGTEVSVESALNELYEKNNKNLYLYWKGNTYDNITGGWESSITTNTWATNNANGITKKNAIFNKEEGYIDLSTDNTYQYVVANTKNKIDCTQYKYINIWYSLSRSYYTLLNIESTLNPIYCMDAPSRIYSRVLNLSDSFVISYPINCSEAGYISFSTLRGVGSDTTTDLKIYGIYLSKTIEP